MKLKVYHAKQPNFRDDIPVDFDDDKFDLVAEVEVEEFGEVFFLTNHVDYAWWENESVTCIKQSRSTSIGDVVVAPDGQKFRCLGSGWGTF